jgi:hypothetical protein
MPDRSQASCRFEGDLHPGQIEPALADEVFDLAQPVEVVVRAFAAGGPPR